ncbi:hypothetical protein NEMIN01_2314, partial [Nematocida minor]|uniref:uncharacterized protein n=1 Tax=Nematocida minor TaxID=1912983 RepID=UPI00221E958E
MIMREAKLTINIEGILKECQSLDRNDISITSVKEINYMNILKRILKDNLKIESEELSEKKKETILKIIENDICQHFIYSLAERSIMQKISPELLSGTEERIKYAFISLATELIRPNQLMYNPSHGITREFDMYGEVDNIVLSYGELDLSTRTCTLMVDDTNLENILQLTLEDMDRENAYHVSYKVDSKGMELFKKYTSVKGRYILDDLYTQEKDKVPLIDYGLKLIYEKYHLINDLIKYIKEMESPSNNNKVQDIPEK